MIIEKYTDYFHDGALIDIQYSQNQIVLFLESAEIDPSDLKDSIELSEMNTVKGKIYLHKIISIKINDKLFSGPLKMKYDSGNIFDLSVKKNKIEISVIWENFPPKPRVNDFDTIIIDAEEIRWETIPDLVDPFWR